MEHRATDTTDVTVKVERKIRVEWLIGAFVSGAIVFGAWAWNISLTLNNVSRDLAQATKTLEKVELSQKEAVTELNKGALRDSNADSRIDDLLRRVAILEAARVANR